LPTAQQPRDLLLRLAVVEGQAEDFAEVLGQSFNRFVQGLPAVEVARVRGVAVWRVECRGGTLRTGWGERLADGEPSPVITGEVEQFPAELFGREPEEIGGRGGGRPRGATG
jgi:hypothetical protein